MKTPLLGFITSLCLIANGVCSDDVIHFDLPPVEDNEEHVTINFQDVSILEFLRYVSKVAGVNFIYDEGSLDFNISLMTGKPTSPKNILTITTELLKQQGIKVEEQGDYLFIDKMDQWELDTLKALKRAKHVNHDIQLASDNYHSTHSPSGLGRHGDFHVYKLQYHPGGEILGAIKSLSSNLAHDNPNNTRDLLSSISSMQWVQSTNSLLYSGNKASIDHISTLIKSLDVPKKQVFIEVLVIETDVKNGQEFGLEWGGGGTYKEKVGMGVGNFRKTHQQTPFAEALQGTNAAQPPTGTDQFPLGRGFDLGVIGDIILHKGKSYLSLGSLVSALEHEGNSTIILNQKIITQDNKLSSIFVGDNIPFTGSVIETVGAAQQTSSNIEYRDVGVKLNITPLLGEGDTITLEIAEEITEVVPDLSHSHASIINGIQTTKTDMSTQVHVPDQSFLVLSGMIRNTKRQHRSGIPCIGGLPVIGAAFSKTTTNDEKRNVIVFVRPQIVNSMDTYETITNIQEEQFKQKTDDPKAYQQGVDMLKSEGVNDGARITQPSTGITTQNTAQSRKPNEVE